MFGILLVDKLQGVTSHDVVDAVREVFGIRKVGHAGALDPLATGLVIVAVGPATRFLQFLQIEPKVYECSAVFGIETDTQDAQGVVIAQADPPNDLTDRIRRELPSFCGDVRQSPPAYSAVKVGGKPLHRYARAGIAVEAPPRVVHVVAFDLIGADEPTATFRIVCAGGTYVRTLIHDLGKRLGCGAHVTALRRIAAGRFDVRDAVATHAIRRESLIPLAEALEPMPIVSLSRDEAFRIRNGQRVATTTPVPAAARVAVADESGEVFCVADGRDGTLQPICVMPARDDDGAVRA
jgi:tRNA pseudouridine55 synthase